VTYRNSRPEFLVFREIEGAGRRGKTARQRARSSEAANKKIDWGGRKSRVEIAEIRITLDLAGGEQRWGTPKRKGQK